MILKICSLRIDPVFGALPVEAIGGRDPGGQRGEAGDPRVVPRRPAALEDHDELWRRGLELAQELGAEAPDDRPVLVVEDREVVDEARRLAHAEPEERVDAPLARVEHLDRVLRPDATPQVGHDAVDALGFRRDPRRPEFLNAFDVELEAEERGGQERRPPHRAGGGRHGEAGAEASERGQRIDLVLPALALRQEVHDAIGQAREHERPPRVPAPSGAGGQDEHGEESPDAPAERPPAERGPRPNARQPRVDREVVLDEDLDEGPEPAGPGEPGEAPERPRGANGQDGAWWRPPDPALPPRRDVAPPRE